MGYKNKKITPKKAWIVVAIVVILAGAVVAYLLMRPEKSSTSNQNQASSDGLVTPNPSEQIPSEITPDKSLFVENDQYKIRYDEQSDTYTVTLYAIINNPSQYESYKADLKTYKQAALQYLTEHDVNVEKVKIVYEPEEAKDL
jgi:hypothetical protein